MKFCKKCNKDINHRGRTAKYCQECNKIKRNERNEYTRKKLNQTPRNKPITINCDTCGKEVLKHVCRLVDSPHTFCSKECLYKYRKKYPSYIPTEKINLDMDLFKNLYKRGKTDKEISRLLGISIGTVRNRRIELDLPTLNRPNEFNYKEKEYLERYGIAPDFATLDAVKVWGGNSYKHELAKWAVCYVLAKRGYHFFTEVKTEKGRIDIYDFTNRNIYEVESILTNVKKERKFKQLFNPNKMSDFFIFDLREVPDEAEAMLKYFGEKV